ncbi:hotdog fold domain-containing protein [Salinisphaera hydrothermalis]|uniref:DUF4442 domain-containing protein n=1 Tax=Salinisphaera hydrothermalis (strain C41B8) TaxID=1304275 RepID=A0A084IJY4_SALHC|nr:hotdog fold domain-containing protein [Salinisphaera hydrothermalis]KEZ77018.1 hypothetical protein C41B8_11900 [Salinisphaera hydrothermalis C41B8]
MTDRSPILSHWRRLQSKPGGRWLFARAVCLRAPYFATIKPSVNRLEPGFCETGLTKRRRLHNHIGTVHAIAMCNLAELAAGLMAEATVRPAWRWIPKSMTVAYRAKAETDLVARARPAETARLDDGVNYDVEVSIIDTRDTEVMHATITLWITRATA